MMFFTLLATAQNALAGERPFYAVKRGDTLAQIAKEKLGSPIYGPRGSLARLKALNLFLKDADVIEVGTRIRVLAKKHKKTSKKLAVASKSRKQKRRTLASIESNDKKFEQFSVVSFTPELFYMRLDALQKPGGEGALLFSDLAMAANFAWTQHWSESFSTWGRVKSSRITIAESLEKRIDNRSQFYSGFLVGAAHSIGSGGRSRLGLELGSEQLMTYRSVSAQTVRLDKTWTPQATLSARIHLTNPDQPLGFGLELKGTVFAPSSSGSYKTKLGGAAMGRLYIDHRLKSDTRLELGLAYKTSKYNSEFARHKRTDLGISFGISWEVGK